VRNAEQLARLDDRLSAVLQGQAQPKDAAEALGFAQLCKNYRKEYAAAGHFYSEVFASQAALIRDPKAGHRYNAACCAALAGRGQGQDARLLPDKVQARLRRQALIWLQADLQAWRRLLEKGSPQTLLVLVKTLRQWQVDPDFAGVRGRGGLEVLPEDERAAWQQLWADVAELLRRAQTRTAPDKKPDGT